MQLEAWWGAHDRFWVCPDQQDARERLAGERVYASHHPCTRSVRNAALNAILAARVLAIERPTLLVSSGAGVAVPFFVLARAAGVATLFVEAYERQDVGALTSRLIGPLCDGVALQWPAQRQIHPKGVCVGPLR
jgi:UDP-N-acetylglucosamine:LPS N-acetylglucosamine transferase